MGSGYFEVPSGSDTDISTVRLPFPSPSSFGEDSASIVLYNSASKRYEFYVVKIVPYAGYDVKSFLIQFNMTNGSGSDFGTLNINIIPRNSYAGSGSWCQYFVYRFVYYPFAHSESYTFNLSTSGTLSDTNNSQNVTVNGTYSSGSIVFYGDCTFRFTGLSESYVRGSVDYVFGSELNYNDISKIITALNQQVILGTTINFYTKEILDQLKSINDNDFTTVPDTTNAVVNDYNNAEEAVIGDSFDKLDEAGNALPDLNSFNSGNQKNAFSFISSNIEFFSGMNGNGSVSKIATVMFVILGLGLASFIIGLTNRRKE